MDAMTPATTPPYISYGTFKNTIQGFGLNGTVPRQIDHTVLPTMGGSMRKIFLASLRFFDLIEESGETTERLRKLASANEPEWKEFMGVLLQDHYAVQLDKLADCSPKTLRESLVESFPGIGGSIVEPATRFLVTAARDVGVAVSSYFGQRRIRVASGAQKRPRKVAKQVAIAPEPQLAEAGHGSPRSFRFELLAKFPEFDPSWEEQQQTAWFAAYQKLLAIVESEPADESAGP